VRPIASIVFPTIFPSFLATNRKLSLSIELHDGLGTVFRDIDIVWFNMSLQVNGSEAIACCNSALNVLETDFWTFNHTREHSSMVRSNMAAGILKNVNLSIQYALGDNYTILFRFTISEAMSIFDRLHSVSLLRGWLLLLNLEEVE